MKKISYFLLITIALSCLTSCDLNDSPNSVSGFSNDLCFQNALSSGHVFKLDGKVWLRGGEGENDHFDITGWTLRHCQVNLGLGREFYPALIEPAYALLAEHPDDYADDERVILLEAQDGPKVYPLDLLNNHIVVNDVVDGNPVMIYYNLFSDSPAVYRRNYCDTTFTFAVSGFTYWDYDILDATNDFLIWDRETESLWWPLIKKAVSGQMKGMWLVLYNESRWQVLTWKEVREKFPDARVLEKDQTMDPPVNWPGYLDVSCK